jgi:cell shape-determining protein MreD
MTDAIIGLLQQYPWLIWSYLIATLLATALRAGWPETSERPRWVVMILAIVDLMQLNLSGPAKLISNKAQTGRRSGG